MSGVIREARAGEGADLTALARRAKAHWDYDPDLLARFAEDIEIPEEAIAAREVRVLEDADGSVLGVARLVAGRPAILEDLWVEPSAIGRGVGRRLWEDAVERARADGHGAIELDADPNAVGFYERMGAIRIGDTPSSIVRGRTLPRMRYDLGG
jgi:ribosomal protein S18 acetylase RimI-like enzyme